MEIPVRQGQYWRVVQGDREPELVQVSAVEGNTVHTATARESTPTLLAATVHTLEDFAHMVLLADPVWPTFGVALPIAFDQAPPAMSQVGLLMSGTQFGMPVGGVPGGAETYWNVVAPDEQSAIDRCTQALDDGTAPQAIRIVARREPGE